MAAVTPRDGVVEYPISKDIPLTGIWRYVPNSNGPIIIAKKGAIDISCRPQNAHNQWTMLSTQDELQALGGAVITPQSQI
jgi:hypothetical protein